MVAAVRLDVIGDRSSRDVAALQAELAQWLDAQLVPAAALPGGGAVPSVNFRTVRH